jgi:hypothetical protein
MPKRPTAREAAPQPSSSEEEEGFDNELHVDADELEAGSTELTASEEEAGELAAACRLADRAAWPRAVP